MYNSFRGLAAVVAISLGGCATELNVSKVKADAAIGHSGIEYSLPMAQFEIEITRRIASCDGDEMKIATEFSITKKSMPDPDATFTVDASSLSHFFNTASTSFAFHQDKDDAGNAVPTPFLKTFNATVVDNVGPTLVSVAKTAAGLSSLSAASAGPARDQKLRCYVDNQEVEVTHEKLKAANEQKQVVEGLTASIEGLQLELSRSVARQAELLPGRLDTVDAEVANLKTYLKAKKDQSKNEEKRLVELLKPITYVSTVTWPEAGNTFELGEPATMPRAELEKWAGEFSVSDTAVAQTSVYISMARLSGVASGAMPKEAGLYYRSAVRGKLVFSSPVLDEKGKVKVDAAGKPVLTVLKEHEETIPQLGHMNVLPVKAKPFESVAYSAEFSIDGTLVSSGYTPTASSSSAVSSMIQGLVEQYSAAEKASASSKQAKLDGELKELQALAAIEEAKKKLSSKEKTDDEVALEALNAETVLINARIARLEAEKKLLQLEGE